MFLVPAVSLRYCFPFGRPEGALKATLSLLERVSLFTPWLPRHIFTLSPPRFLFHWLALACFKNILGFYLVPLLQSSVGIHRGMPICQGRSGVKLAECERAGCYSQGLPQGNRLV